MEWKALKILVLIKVLDSCLLLWQSMIDESVCLILLDPYLRNIYSSECLLSMWQKTFQSNMCSFSSQNRLLYKQFCLQPFYPKDSVSLLFAYCVVHYLSCDFFLI